MWKNKEKTSSYYCVKQIKSQIKKEIKVIQKEGINNHFIDKILQPVYNFIVVFTQDELSSIKMAKIPFSLIVNLDYQGEKGSHWLSIHINHETIEIFDSLGFESKYFNHYPKLIISFINKFSFNRFVLCSPVLQPVTSKLCGLYAIYFILSRQTKSFQDCLQPFNSHLYDNDQKLINFFK